MATLGMTNMQMKIDIVRGYILVLYMSQKVTIQEKRVTVGQKTTSEMWRSIHVTDMIGQIIEAKRKIEKHIWSIRNIEIRILHMTDLDLAGGMHHMMRSRGKGVRENGMVEMKEEVPTEVMVITEVTEQSPIQSQEAKEMAQVHKETVVNII